MKIWISLITLIGLTIACTSGPTRNAASTENWHRNLDAKNLYYHGKNELKPTGLIKAGQENHFGEDLDLSVRRPAVNLAGTVYETKYKKEGYYLIANFFHNGKFWIARVPEVGVSKIYFQLVRFPPEFIAAHSLMRFEMMKNAPVEIVAPMPDQQLVENGMKLENLPEAFSTPEFRIYNLAISAEAQWTKQDPKQGYDLTRGQFNAFVQIVRFESMEERLVEFWNNGNQITQTLLDERKNMDKVLRTALEKSEKDGIGVAYNTLNYNCTTTAFDIYEQATGSKPKGLQAIQRFFDRTIPVLAPGTMKNYGGVDAQPLYNDRTLWEESRTAYNRAVNTTGRVLCPAKMEKSHCENLKAAQRVLSYGPIDQSKETSR